VKPIAVFDIETDPFKKHRSPVPFLAGFYDGKTKRIFKGPDCIKDCYAVMRKFPGYIYAHSGGKFDFRYLLKLFAKDKAEIRPIKGRLARVILPNECRTEFRDSYCILPVPLKAGGQKKAIDYRKFERDVRAKHMPEILEYFDWDLYSLYEMVNEFVGQYGFGMTMAGRTFAKFKADFDLDPPKTNEFHDRAFRRFYYGGRVEFFELGHLAGTFRMIDINSAYPAAMTKPHAFGLEFETMSKLPKHGAEQCFVRFIGHCSGGLPHRGEDQRLSFAEHDGEFFVTGWEFLAARKAGCVTVREMISVHRPIECRDFSRFVNHFYKIKRESVKGSSDELFAKLFLNSSYGRFALNPREFKDAVMLGAGEEPEENEANRKKIKKLVKKKHPGIRGESLREKCAAYWAGFDGKWELANTFEDEGIYIWEKSVEVRSNSFYNVATAASITGCVRAFMFESLRKVKRPVYCDTDCILCEDTGDLTLGPGLGEWKLECVSEPGGVWIAAKKLYALKKAGVTGKKAWKIACKGVRLTPKEICRVAEGERITTTLDAPTFSLFTTKTAKGDDRDFVTRRTVRDDMRGFWKEQDKKKKAGQTRRRSK
jgi:hypothetical protein